MRKTKEIRTRENVIFQTRPRFFMYLKSAIIKFIIILIIVYFFRDLMTTAATIQEYLISIVQIPLVQGVTVFLLLIILILFLWIIWDLFKWRSTSYKLTDQRIITKSGILRKNKNYIHYDKIQDVTVSQSLTERITSSGDIEVFGGHEHTRIILNDVPRPKDVEEMINRMIEGEMIFEKPEKHPKTGKKLKYRDSVMKRHNEKFRRE